MSVDQIGLLDSKSILDKVVVLLNILVLRHVINKQDAPPWFVKDLQEIDFKANTMQSAIDQPEDEDVSFALAKPDKAIRAYNRDIIHNQLTQLLATAAAGGVQIEFHEGDKIEQLFLPVNVMVNVDHDVENPAII